MSSDTLYRLAESTCVEPLVGRWVAWAHVMAPALFSMHLTNYQMQTLRSYLSNPALHETCCRDPRLLGGPFVDIAKERSGEVAALLAEMEEKLADNVEFARGLSDFQNRIVEEAKGESLQSYYERAPKSLRGFIELIYDYYDRPIIRCLEGMLYRSSYYKKELQCLRLFRQEHDLSRPNYLSTPRLSDETAYDWRVRFDDARVDALFDLDREPKPLADIFELLGAAPDEKRRLRSLFEEGGPRRREPWRDDSVRVRYFGHACVLVESNGISILLDPLISIKPSVLEIDRYTFDDLPGHIDYALITHGHHDHFVVETLLRLRSRIGTLIVPKNADAFFGDISLRQLAGQIGFRNVTEVECLDELPILGGRIVAVPFLGEHNDLPSAKSGYFVQMNGRSILFGADSNCLDATVYTEIHRMLGPIDALFVGMECVGAPLSWVYGPVLPTKPNVKYNKDRRSNGCNASAAFELARAIDCRRAFIYAVGREPWVRYLLALQPSEGDVYMAEIGAFIRRLRVEAQVDGELLFGKAEFVL
ncbi:MBL fold metallo-hydrolase [Methylosinus sp. Sm6]|uniref:MBL fold metallo-hydrolase n=1 Tax=Methylosinus sp. Sm6 TaxID=2866948 RepID=UPI001C99615C|nr:MBL fold metallo-hydrolase [Methylosinus sp. Sm6]MBY6243521.1 MBL fold metallo-hydrolase [Methylosinus sp. Sm6]